MNQGGRERRGAWLWAAANEGLTAECRWPHRYGATTTIFTSFFVPLYSAAARTEVNLSSITGHILAHTHTPKVAHTHTFRETQTGTHICHISKWCENVICRQRTATQKAEGRAAIGARNWRPAELSMGGCFWLSNHSHTHAHTHTCTETPRRDTHTHTQGQQLTALPCSKFAASSEQKAHKVRN